MWLIFVYNGKARRYVIEFTGNETIGEVKELFRTTYGIKEENKNIILSLRTYTLRDEGKRLNEYPDIKDETEITLNVQQELGQ